MTDPETHERLYCRCGREVAIVRVGPGRLGLVHLHAPANRHRPVLVRPAVERVADLADEDFNVEGAPEFNGSFR